MHTRSTPRFFLILAFLGTLATAAAAPPQPRPDKQLIKVPLNEVPAAAKRALVIGIGDYKNVRGLALSIQDAKAFAALLETKMAFPRAAINLMTDDAAREEDRPTYTNLRARVRRVVQKEVDQNSVLVVFYSGHGVHADDQDWLVPSDGDPEDVNGTCVSITREIVNPLQAKQPRRALLFFDACRSFIRGTEVRGAGFGLGTKGLRLPEMAELYSCQPKEVSLEGKGALRQGVFTHFLLNGLAGDPEAAEADGNVTFDSLLRYVRGGVSDYAKSEFGIEQNPIGNTTAGSMVLARAAARVRLPNSADPAGVTREAYQLFMRRQHPEAASRARQALALDAKDALALAVLGNARLRLGDRSRGEDALRESLKLDDNCGLAHAGMGYLLGLRDTAAALKEYERALQLDPSLAVAHNNLAVLYSNQGRRAEAEIEFRQAARLWESAGVSCCLPYSGLARLYTAQLRYEDAERAARRALEIEPSAPEGHLALGVVYSARRLAKEAEAEYRQAVALQPEVWRPRLALAHFLGEQQRFTEAEAECRRAIASAADDLPELRNELGIALKGLKRWDEAEKAFQRAAELSPALPYPHNNLGSLYTDQKRWADAEREFRRALELGPLDPHNRSFAYGGLGWLYAAQQKYADAEREFEQATEADPNQARLWLRLGGARYILKRYPQAGDAYTRALRLEPNNADAHNGVAIVAQATQHNAEAEQEYRRAIDLAPAVPLYHANLGNLYRDLKRWEDAEKEYRRAVELSPKTASYHTRLGDALLAQKNYDAAIAEYQEALRLDTNNAAARQGIEAATKAKGGAGG